MALSTSGNEDYAELVLSDPLLDGIRSLVEMPSLFPDLPYEPWTWRQRLVWKLSPSTLRWKLAKRIYPEGFEDDGW